MVDAACLHSTSLHLHYSETNAVFDSVFYSFLHTKKIPIGARKQPGKLRHTEDKKKGIILYKWRKTAQRLCIWSREHSSKLHRKHATFIYLSDIVCAKWIRNTPNKNIFFQTLFKYAPGPFSILHRRLKKNLTIWNYVCSFPLKTICVPSVKKGSATLQLHMAPAWSTCFPLEDNSGPDILKREDGVVLSGLNASMQHCNNAEWQIFTVGPNKTATKTQSHIQRDRLMSLFFQAEVQEAVLVNY